MASGRHERIEAAIRSVLADALPYVVDGRSRARLARQYDELIQHDEAATIFSSRGGYA